MLAEPTFGTQLIGQTEKALNAILAGQLGGTTITEPQWVTLTIVVMRGGVVEHADLVRQVSGALKTTEAEAETRVEELSAAGLFGRSDDGSSVRVTDAGEDLHGRIREAVIEITQRLWGDVPEEDLQTAARVLSTVLARANDELQSP